MTKFIALFYTLLAMLLIAVVSYSMQKSERTFSPPKFTIGVVLKTPDSDGKSFTKISIVLPAEVTQ